METVIFSMPVLQSIGNRAVAATGDELPQKLVTCGYVEPIWRVDCAG